MINSKLRYPIMIKWSDEDACFLVGFPDFPGQEWRTHGDTYEETFKNGIEALESLLYPTNLQETRYQFPVFYFLIMPVRHNLLNNNIFSSNGIK